MPSVTRWPLAGVPLIALAVAEARATPPPIYEADHILDESWEREGDACMADLKEPTSEYFKRQCWVAIEPDEKPARHMIDDFGYDQLVFSTDYPHGDSAYPHAVEGFEELNLPADAKVKIVGENWSRLYKIPLEHKAPR